MRKTLKEITTSMLAIMDDPRANRVERLEAAKVVAACAGVLLPDTSESFLSQRQAVQLRQARQRIAEKMLNRKEVRRKQNRRAYIRRQIKALEPKQQEVITNEQ